MLKIEKGEYPKHKKNHQSGGDRERERKQAGSSRTEKKHTLAELFVLMKMRFEWHSDFFVKDTFAWLRWVKMII